jgi:hypothetical protein
MNELLIIPGFTPEQFTTLISFYIAMRILEKITTTVWSAFATVTDDDGQPMTIRYTLENWEKFSTITRLGTVGLWIIEAVVFIFAGGVIYSSVKDVQMNPVFAIQFYMGLAAGLVMLIIATFIAVRKHIEKKRNA